MHNNLQISEAESAGALCVRSVSCQFCVLNPFLPRLHEGVQVTAPAAARRR